MADEITPELFEHLVELAALELGPDESEYLRAQLNGQLKAIAELERIAIPDDVPAAAHGIVYTPELSPPLRADEPRPADSAAPGHTLADRILAQAPERDERYFVAPETQHTEL
jgi:aspartyl-tRNA(Asn)/glutamyl-tRNA(Gln) amidotransferase subunit C